MRGAWLQGSDSSAQSRKVLPRAQSTGVMPASFFSRVGSLVTSLSKSVDPDIDQPNRPNDIRKDIEDVVNRLKKASVDEFEARKLADHTRKMSEEIEAHMGMLQAQVEAAVVAATGENGGKVSNTVLSLELESLVGKTRQIEQSLRAAQIKAKEADTAHYWEKSRLDGLVRKKQELEARFLDSVSSDLNNTMEPNRTISPTPTIQVPFPQSISNGDVNGSNELTREDLVRGEFEEAYRDPLNRFMKLVNTACYERIQKKLKFELLLQHNHLISTRPHTSKNHVVATRQSSYGLVRLVVIHISSETAPDIRLTPLPHADLQLSSEDGEYPDGDDIPIIEDEFGDTSNLKAATLRRDISEISAVDHENNGDDEVCVIEMDVRERIGVVLTPGACVTELKVNGQAQLAGVRLGWRFTDIAGVAVSDEASFRKALMVTKALAQPSEGGDPSQSKWPFTMQKAGSRSSKLARNQHQNKLIHPEAAPGSSSHEFVDKGTRVDDIDWLLVIGLNDLTISSNDRNEDMLQDFDIIVGVNEQSLVGLSFEKASSILENVPPPIKLTVLRHTQALEMIRKHVISDPTPSASPLSPLSSLAMPSSLSDVSEEGERRYVNMRSEPYEEREVIRSNSEPRRISSFELESDPQPFLEARWIKKKPIHKGSVKHRSVSVDSGYDIDGVVFNTDRSDDSQGHMLALENADDGQDDDSTVTDVNGDSPIDSDDKTPSLGRGMNFLRSTSDISSEEAGSPRLEDINQLFHEYGIKGIGSSIDEGDEEYLGSTTSDSSSLPCGFEEDDVAAVTALGFERPWAVQALEATKSPGLSGKTLVDRDAAIDFILENVESMDKLVALAASCKKRDGNAFETPKRVIPSSAVPLPGMIPLTPSSKPSSLPVASSSVPPLGIDHESRGEMMDEGDMVDRSDSSNSISRNSSGGGGTKISDRNRNISSSNGGGGTKISDNDRGSNNSSSSSSSSSSGDFKISDRGSSSSSSSSSGGGGTKISDSDRGSSSSSNGAGGTKISDNDRGSSSSNISRNSSGDFKISDSDRGSSSSSSSSGGGGTKISDIGSRDDQAAGRSGVGSGGSVNVIDAGVSNSPTSKAVTSVSITEATIAPPTGATAVEDNDPILNIYRSMLKMGIADAAVAQKMELNGIDPKRLNLEAPPKLSPTASKKKDAVSKRRKLQWETVKPSRGSIWLKEDKEEEDSDQEEDKDHPGRVSNSLLYDFESLFVAKPVDKVKKSTNGAIKKKVTIQLLDSQRAMNGGILLSRMKCSPVLIRKRLLSNEGDEFENEQLEALQGLIPTLKEKSILLSFKGKPDELGICEQAMLQLMMVPHIAERLNAIIFRRKFNDFIAEISDHISSIAIACMALRNSEELQRVFHIILLLGNKLNEENDKKAVTYSSRHLMDSGGKDAKAFSLRSLLNLATTKAFDGRTSVLEYLALILEREDANLLNFSEKLVAPVNAAVRASLDHARKELHALKSSYNKIEKFVKDQKDAQLENNSESGHQHHGRVSKNSALESMLATRTGGAPKTTTPPQKVSKNSALEAMLASRTGGAAKTTTPAQKVSKNSALEAMLATRTGGAPKTTTPAQKVSKNSALESMLATRTGIKSPVSSKSASSPKSISSPNSIGSLKMESRISRQSSTSSTDSLPDPNLDAFIDSLSQFLASAQSEIEAVENELDLTTDKFNDLVLYFSEKEGIDCGSFFAVFHEFFQSFAKACSTLERRRKQEAKQEALKHKTKKIKLKTASVEKKVMESDKEEEAK